MSDLCQRPTNRPSGPVRAVLIALVFVVLAGAQSAGASPARPGGPTREGRALAQQLFLEGRTLFNLGRFREALARFRRAYETVPLSGLLYNIAQCHRFLQDWKEAIYFYRGYLRDNPGAPNTQVVQDLITRCETKRRDQSTLRDAAKRHFEKGRTSFRLSDFKAALAHFRAAYQAVPLAGYLFHIAQAHHRLHQYAKAVTLYEGYLQDNPGAPEMGHIRGLIAQCRKALAARQRVLRPRLVVGGDTPGTQVPSPADRPIYRRWWLWTAVAAGLVALTVGLGVGVGNRSSTTGVGLPYTQLGTVDWR